MKTLKMVDIDINIKKALQMADKQIREKYKVDSIILFGSVARGEDDSESDADLLILTENKLTRDERHGITEIVYYINLNMGTNISTVVADIKSWNTGMYSVLPIHNEIDKDGIMING